MNNQKGNTLDSYSISPKTNLESYILVDKTGTREVYDPELVQTWYNDLVSSLYNNCEEA